MRFLESVKREAMRLLRNISGESTKASEQSNNAHYQHQDLLKTIMEQQSLLRHKDFEQQQKFQYEQQVGRTRLAGTAFFDTMNTVSLSRNKNVNDRSWPLPNNWN